MTVQIDKLQYLTYQLCKYLYGNSFDADFLYCAIRECNNPIQPLALVLLHHNRKHIGLLSLQYQEQFKACVTANHYNQYFQQLQVVPEQYKSDINIAHCYTNRYKNYYYCIQRLIYDEDIDLLSLNDCAIIDYSYSSYINNYVERIADIFTIEDEYHNINYLHYGKFYCISIRHLLFALIDNKEPYTQGPFQQDIFLNLVNKYKKELNIFYNFYYNKC